jgi:hypothetical protein
MEEMRNAHSILVGKFERKRPLLRRPRHGWDDNIRTDVRKIVAIWCGLDSSS